MMENQPQTLTVTSSAFEDQGWMPVRHTRDGEDVSPELCWEGAPEGTQSYVVTMEDRDAPLPGLHLLTWLHWLVYDIPAQERGLPEALPRQARLQSGAKQGLTSYRRPGYRGPSPPFGVHRYIFRVYALDTMLGLEPSAATGKSVRQAMAGHVLAEGVLVGRYGRRQKTT